jgi:hypothetical protein
VVWGKAVALSRYHLSQHSSNVVRNAGSSRNAVNPPSTDEYQMVIVGASPSGVLLW